MRSEQQICQMGAPQGRIFTVCERSVCAFQQGWISKLLTFLSLPHMSPFAVEEREKKRKHAVFFFPKFVFLIPSALFASSSRRGAAEEMRRMRAISQPAWCDKWNADRDGMETDHKSTPEIPTKSIFSLFFFFFTSTETALGPIWFGFSMNYYGLDPVSADKAPKCPGCILILPMNIQQPALISLLFSHLYWDLTVLVITRWKKMW